MFYIPTHQIYNQSIYQLYEYFQDSYSNKYCILPISLSPKEDKFLKTYCIPVIIYLGKHKLVHEDNYVQYAHPSLHISHDGGHSKHQKNDHLKLSVKTPSKSKQTSLMFLSSFIEIILYFN